MPDAFIFRTEDGQLYEMVDEKQLFNVETWILLVDGRRNIVLYFGSMLLNQSDSFSESGKVVVKKVDESIRDAIKSGTCIGKHIFYVPESVMKEYWGTGKLTLDVWEQTISKYAEGTRKIKELYVKKF